MEKIRNCGIRKGIFLAIIAFVTSFVVSSCGKSNTPAPAKKSKTTFELISDQSWYLSSVKVGNSESAAITQGIADVTTKDVYAFNADNTFSVKRNGTVTTSGTWTIDGSKMVLSYKDESGNNVNVSFQVKVSESSFEWILTGSYMSTDSSGATTGPYTTRIETYVHH